MTDHTIIANQTIEALHLAGGKETAVTIERQDDMIAVFDRNGTETHRLAVADAELIPALRGTFVVFLGGIRFRVEPHHDVAVRAMFPRAGKQTHGVPYQPARTVNTTDKRQFALGFLNAAKLATIVYAILGVIGGIIVAATTVEYDSGFYNSDEHPYVGWGIAAIVATLASAVVVGAVLTALSHLIERRQRSRTADAERPDSCENGLPSSGAGSVPNDATEHRLRA